MPLYSFEDLHRKISRQTLSRLHDFNQTLDVCMRRNMWQEDVVTNPRCGHKADQWAMWVRADAEWFVKENHLLKMKPLSVFVDEPYFINMMDQHGRKYANLGATYNKWYHHSDLPCFTCRNTCQQFLSSPHTFHKVDMRTI